MGIDINKFFPYNKMKLVTVDGQQMLRIPRIYVKNEVISSGPYTGKVAYFMNESPYKGYHLHPAFMNGGSAMSALDLSCYEAGRDRYGLPTSLPGTGCWERMTRAQACEYAKYRNKDNNNPEKSGWHCWDIYCHHLLARIMLFEFGTTSITQQGSGSPEFVYRGIHQPAGNPDIPMWIPGIGNIGGYIYIADNLGQGAFINTGLKCPNNGWPTAFSMIKGNQFDLGDVFIATTTSPNETDGTCSDYQRLALNGVNEAGYMTGHQGQWRKDPINGHGMFAIGQQTCGGGPNDNWRGYGSPNATWANDNNDDHIKDVGVRFRLAHWVK